MKARIKKGVRPYGGRIFPVIERKQYPNGRRVVIVDVGKTAQMSIYVADLRAYGEHEVEIITENKS